ncbi:ACP S-malonyltransferase [Chromobacterium sp. IIBBL 290-4]|uniref:ACP S-malonyltransferase n=1 Tax=Chromobacterium sp. IIBBL 290-4 TaxID=2953890 RepID=UPI0020B6EBCA|nr:ACP S-malonyltransferase [Chromobacterium sp. IIBBL 290-4]UTH76434.1 ACP S-malonyltransferase [Chromobacterium sp. IIBBL 290-4]
MFSGQGSQYLQMGRSLYDSHAGYREILQRLDRIALEEGSPSILESIYPSSRPSAPLDDILVTHPAIFMLEYALATILIEQGVRPDAVLGSSLGEVAAAVISGVTDVERAMRFVVRQARLLDQQCPAGGMTAVLAPTGLFHELPALSERTELAAVNFDEHFVVSGTTAALDDAERILQAQGRVFQRLPVSRAFHSSEMDGVRDAFLDLVADLATCAPSVPFISSTFGKCIETFPADYFWNVVRGQLNLPDAVGALEHGGLPHEYIDVGPSGTLANFVKRCLPAASASTCSFILSPFDPSLAPFERVIGRCRSITQQREDFTVSHSKVVYMFPGQGAQQRGMGEGLFEAFPELTAAADRILGYSIKELCLHDPRNELAKTEFTQPALYVTNVLSYLSKVRSGHTPDYVLGHSLGEFCALFAAGAFDFETGLHLVKKRGELMAQTVEGGMAAVLNLDREAIADAFRRLGCTTLDFANFNAPNQTVISGPSADLQAVQSALEAAGGMVIPLNVSAPFHSRYMSQAMREFGDTLRATRFGALSIPVIANVTAEPYLESEISKLLERQVGGSVRWVESVQYLLRNGVTVFEEIGPGNILTNLVAKIRREPLPDVPSESSRAAPARTPSRTSDVALHLGSASFREAYGVLQAYVVGGMYKGIASIELVACMANAGYLAFFGAGGLQTSVVEQAIDTIRVQVGERTFGMNLVCNLANPGKEMELVQLFLRKGITVIEAAAFMQITPALVLYRLRGLGMQGGKVKADNRIIAKISRPEVAQQFLEPAPRHVVDKLLEQGLVTDEQARLAAQVPMADDLTVEADSGGHTDMGVAFVLLPTIIRQRDLVCRERGYEQPVRVGAAGGIGSPESAAAAFILGADFIVTGSINQCTPQAGTSDAVKDLLQGINVQDTEYAPAGDMFEIGARVQVLKRGVFFPARANKLYDLWRRYESLDEIDEKTARQIQDTYFKRSFDEVYAETREYLRKVAPQEIDKAERNPKHKMALIFRWYFVHSSRLAMKGSEQQRVDYQVHCGPALGAFNQWVKGTQLENWRQRHADVIAERLMAGAAYFLKTRLTDLFGRSAPQDANKAAVTVD